MKTDPALENPCRRAQPDNGQEDDEADERVTDPLRASSWRSRLGKRDDPNEVDRQVQDDAEDEQA